MIVNLQRIKAERIAKGLSQDNMATYLGFKNRSSYSKLESGEREIGADTLMSIAIKLDYPYPNFFIHIVPENQRPVKEESDEVVQLT